jgi:hypothetical protein
MNSLSEHELSAYLLSPATAAALPMDFWAELCEDNAVTVARLAQLGYTVTAGQAGRNGCQQIHVQGLRFSSTVHVALMDDPLTTNGTNT